MRKQKNLIQFLNDDISMQEFYNIKVSNDSNKRDIEKNRWFKIFKFSFGFFRRQESYFYYQVLKCKEIDVLMINFYKFVFIFRIHKEAQGLEKRNIII